VSGPQDAILAVNAGSSSLKFALYPVHGLDVDAARLTCVVDGLEPAGAPRICVRGDGEDRQTQLEPAPGDVFDHALEALRVVLENHAKTLRVAAIAHRIVHGGRHFFDSVVIDDAAMAYLDSLGTLAPLHQPHNLAGVRACQRAYPDLLQVGCFDTGFHATLPIMEQLFALPKALRLAGIRRYGFHGLSYRYVMARLFEHSARAGQKVVVSHLGNGASACAMLDGKSVASSMGFSALDGLMMGSRCGALDAGVVLHLMRQGWSREKIEHALYRESGLLGVSGLSADMRTLRASSSPDAAQAIELFVHRLIKECGTLTACLGGLDLLAFTGGIGEHDSATRQSACDRLHYLGVEIDAELNRAAVGDVVSPIHSKQSKVEVWVVPTDEGRVAAGDAARLYATV